MSTSGSSNRTFMELKFLSEYVSFTLHNSSNRTFMELKSQKMVLAEIEKHEF